MSSVFLLKVNFFFASIFIILGKTYYKFWQGVFSCLSPTWLSWNKYSEGMLRALEKKILQIVKTPHRGFYLDIGPVVGPADKIWTLSFNTESKNTPIVLLHGLGAGVALWCLNIDSISASRPLYAIDLLGFGRSSRPNFDTDGLKAEYEMVKALEEWRKEVKLQEFILLGHSMGGFLATSYAIQYPRKVRHLILADPWGFSEKPRHTHNHVPLWIKTLSYMVQPFNPLTAVRIAGPFGPWFISTIRPDISKKYAFALEDPDLIPQYIYQCNSRHPSGESAFHAMMSTFGWAKNPMVRRFDQLDDQVSITLLYGSRSWIDHAGAEMLKEKRYKSYVKLQDIKIDGLPSGMRVIIVWEGDTKQLDEAISGAGHHVYADRPEAFNQIVIDACNQTDKKDDDLAIMAPDSTDTESEVPESDKNL